MILAVAAIAPAVFLICHAERLPEAPKMLIEVPGASAAADTLMYESAAYWGLSEEDLDGIVFLAVDRCCASCDCVNASEVDAESGLGATYGNFCLIKAAYDLGLADEVMGGDEYRVKERFDSLLQNNPKFRNRFESLPHYDWMLSESEYKTVVGLAEAWLWEEGDPDIDMGVRAFEAQWPIEYKEWSEGHRCTECALKIIKFSYTYDSPDGVVCSDDVHSDTFDELLAHNKDLRRMWYSIPSAK